MNSKPFKIPQSVLVIIHTADLQVLLLRRVGSMAGVDYWQPVTGSKDAEDETWVQTAIREVGEETGIDAHHPDCTLRDWNLENIYPIYPQWLHRYAPGVRMNTEHVLSLQVPSTPTSPSARESTPPMRGMIGERRQSVAIPYRTAKPFCGCQGSCIHDRT